MKKKAAKSNQVGKMASAMPCKKGGAVKPKTVKKELKPEGASAGKRLDKFARGGAAKKPGKNHKTQVNVIVGGDKPAMPMPVPMGGGAPIPPPPMAPRPGMKKGGAVKMSGGAGGGLGRLEKSEIQKNKK